MRRDRWLLTVEKKIGCRRRRAAALEGRGRRARAGVAPVVVIEGEIQNGHGAQLLFVLLPPQLVFRCYRLHPSTSN